MAAMFGDIDLLSFDFVFGALEAVSEIFKLFKQGTAISDISKRIPEISDIKTPAGNRKLSDIFTPGSKGRKRLDGATRKRCQN
ncbi:hypothetical protein GGH94_000854 [Coemansia aciculifera]|uniref:Uncharacterized protein n=1 Tax=Coemansia aciculifera TaxID=417176 RepID=A0A9W8IVD1_9FUNG|nr:hypothetical protein GGH94_000854 [Coemansia aciculifera]